ncbi:hypothetical protein DEAC_c12360 [Desulfosporosinus acididurans]|uniref:DUF3786 domain-containing protein n=1 Tax=Desulfosporosinus acididurans TaxID=476652 RepID=A0A0J1FSX2_9FIRM|nr:hypothetical protein DEAC_c12360 [Desulfosporosinus acididurans]
MEIESNYRNTCQKFWRDIKKSDPTEITAVRTVSYNSDTRQFIVLFFNEEYVVDSDQEIIRRRRDGYVPEVLATIIILNYLANARPFRGSDVNWVSIKELPGGMIFYSAFHKTVISVLIESFGHQSSRLMEVSHVLDGKPGPFGDASVILRAFPEIPLCVVIWEGDEEVNPNATILYDFSIGQILDTGISIDLGVYLAEELKKLAQGQFGKYIT